MSSCIKSIVQVCRLYCVCTLVVCHCHLEETAEKAVGKAASSKKDSLSFFLFDFSKGKASVDSTLLLLWM